MLYLSGWKSRSTPHDGVQGQPSRLRGFIKALAAALCVSAVWIAAYRYSSDVRDLISRPQNGEIIVSSPTVYTRQRLVNDRLKQVAWLEKQITAADGVSAESNSKPEFRMIDQLRGTTSRLSLVGEVGSASPQATDTKSSAQPSTNSSNAQQEITVAPTTAALFRAKNSFRDEVRAEMMETQLDDRHDILGNTIYRFSFQASVLAGTQPDALAGIAIRISHCPNRKKIQKNSEVTTCSQPVGDRALTTDILYRNDYNRLYFDWIRDLQKRITSSVDNLTEQFWVEQRDPTLRLLFSRFITGRLCESHILGKSPGSRIDDRCSPETISAKGGGQDTSTSASNLDQALRLTQRFLDQYLQQVEAAQNRSFDVSLASALKRYPFIKSKGETSPGFEQRVRNSPRCFGATPRSIPLSDLVQEDASSRRTKVQTFPPGTDLPCPFIESPVQRMRAGLVLYRMVSESQVPQNDRPEQDILAALMARAQTPFDIHAEARCFAADYMRAKLNGFERPARESERIDTFLQLTLTGKETGDCQLLISSKPTPPIDELEYYLNKDTDVFSYTVTPKNLAENISTTAEVRDAYQMLAQHQIGLGSESVNVLAKALKERSEDLRTVLEHPLVVGFGSGRQPLQFVDGPGAKDRSPTVRGTELGWIIAPHIRPGGKLVQIDGQYALTAVVSIPSWWRSVEIDIDTCWIPRTELERYSSVSTLLFCPEHKPIWTIVQLPGAIAELSRKLGFEVVQEPYVTNPRLQKLNTGELGQLIFTGGRLWRSTTVTLGSQLANSITVLPNMEGIVARFDCVKPQPKSESAPGPEGDLNIVPARVWTSEGVTDSMPVSLIGTNKCPAENKLLNEQN